MVEIVKFPTKYDYVIEPGHRVSEPEHTVTVGTKVSITVIYEQGSHEDYRPVLELRSSPHYNPTEPKNLEMRVVDGNARFEVNVDSFGLHSYRLKPFSKIYSGEFINIYGVTQEEVAEVLKVIKEYAKSNQEEAVAVLKDIKEFEDSHNLKDKLG